MGRPWLETTPPLQWQRAKKTGDKHRLRISYPKFTLNKNGKVLANMLLAPAYCFIHHHKLCAYEKVFEKSTGKDWESYERIQRWEAKIWLRR